VEGYDDCVKLLKMGEYNRHYAETRMNHQSSRSHTLFRLHVESVATTATGEDAGTNVIRESVLNFVDLAGSEKVSNHSFASSGVSGGSMSEGLFISPKGSLTRKSNYGI
jgi:centromeric protein E